MILDLINTIMPRYSYKCLFFGDLFVLDRYCSGREYVVELGCNMGTTTRLLSGLAKKVITVDVFDMFDNVELDAQKECCRNNHLENKNSAAAIRESLSDCKNVDVIQATTRAASTGFAPLSIDTLFVDADHHFEGVYRDYIDYFDKVKVDGYLLFHDTVHCDNPGVNRLYTEILQKDARLKEEIYSFSFEGVILFSSISVFKKESQ